MAQQQDTRLPNPKWIWPFELVEQIGEGGMGIVYKARYVVNGRFVALKMLPPEVNDPTTLARFEREVEVLKNLKHPNIVRCFGGTCEDKRRFYAMELLEGGTLEDKLQAKGPLPWEQVIQYALQICSGLQCLHEKGVVHRDIKPSNFLLTPQDQLKLSDFGLASVAAARKITAAGKTAGTFLYMAPEQIRGKTVTPRTDLYALGCVLYELLAGVPPFIGETPAATLHLHCNAPAPRITEKVLDCPVALERILLKLLAKDPEERYASANEVIRDLKGVSQTISVAGRDLVKSSLQLNDSVPQKKAIASSSIETSRPSFTPPTKSRSLWIMAGLLVLSAGLNLSLWGQVQTGKKWEVLWIRAASSADEALRLQATRALGEMASTSEAATAKLALNLNDPNPAIRLVSVEGIGKSGGAGKKYMAELLRIRKAEPTPEVREAAEAAVRAIEGAVYYSWVPPFWLVLLAILGGTGAAVWHWWKQQHSMGLAETPTSNFVPASAMPRRSI